MRSHPLKIKEMKEISLASGKLNILVQGFLKKVYAKLFPFQNSMLACRWQAGACKRTGFFSVLVASGSNNNKNHHNDLLLAFVCICTLMHRWVWHGLYVEVRGQPLGVSFFQSQLGTWGVKLRFLELETSAFIQWTFILSRLVLVIN